MTLSELDLFRSMLRVRVFEETVLEEFKRGVFAGTTHTSLGQEANAVGVISCLQERDVIVTNHRCHGHFLAYGGDIRALFAELMGRETGVCGGRGGSQQLHWRNLYSNGVQGGIVPIATGMALAEKMQNTGAVVTVFIGDGTFGEGVIYEAFNMAGIWNAPLMIVVENNHIAQTTPTAVTTAGTIADRFNAFSIPTTELNTSDVTLIVNAAVKVVEAVRIGSRPQALILDTARFGPHSKGDDTRPEEEVHQLVEQRDPLALLEKRLDSALTAEIRRMVEDEVQNAFHTALADPEAMFSTVNA